MSPEEYNQQQRELGNLREEHIVQLVLAWQEQNDLIVDGYCGPKTLETLDPVYTSRLGITTLAVAVEEIGNGETDGNNSGPHVARYKGIPDDDDSDDDGSWCANFISYCAHMAASRLGVNLPFKKSGGAKRLLKNVSEAGSLVAVPRPGDLVCWDRGKRGSWQGHIGIVEKVENGILYTIEGNVGRFPSVVKRFQHDLSDQPRLEGFARMPKV
jgi:hypothetical protein